eukprot:EC095485.1.p1 GENE.EC095485.1~~EC095485.1.p1  ORF type:complete len:185 (-),score=0.59 EC095485.1:2-556(-)
MSSAAFFQSYTGPQVQRCYYFLYAKKLLGSSFKTVTPSKKTPFHPAKYARNDKSISFDRRPRIPPPDILDTFSSPNSGGSVKIKKRSHSKMRPLFTLHVKIQINFLCAGEERFVGVCEYPSGLDVADVGVRVHIGDCAVQKSLIWDENLRRKRRYNRSRLVTLFPLSLRRLCSLYGLFDGGRNS